MNKQSTLRLTRMPTEEAMETEAAPSPTPTPTTPEVESSTTTSTSSTLGVVDALPYIDLGYDEPGVREAVRLHD